MFKFGLDSKELPITSQRGPFTVLGTPSGVGYTQLTYLLIYLSLFSMYGNKTSFLITSSLIVFYVG